MKQIKWLTCISAVVLLSSCVTENQSQTRQSSVPAGGSERSSAGSSPQQTFNNPLLSVSNPAKVVPVPGLTPATNQEERLVAIFKGRNDPFARIATTPIVVTTSQNLQPTPIALTPLPSVPSPPLILPSSSLPVLPATNVLVPPQTSLTSLANGIEISGVMQVRGKLTAIVKVPEEPTSRHVSVGDYLGNGKILVKRIEMKTNQEPLVILEQNGVEVIKSVGGVREPVS